MLKLKLQYFVRLIRTDSFEKTLMLGKIEGRRRRGRQRMRWFGTITHQFSSVQSLSRVPVSNSVTPWTAARQASLSITSSQSLLKLMSIKSVMPSNHLILCHPFSSCLQPFPASGSFPRSQFFASILTHTSRQVSTPGAF